MQVNDTVVFAQSRKQSILDMVKERGVVTVNELSDQFSVSQATIRSDLRELDAQGLLERTHGGAIYSKQSTFELNTSQKVMRFAEEKKAIAEAALEFISNGDTIVLDTGTTIFQLAKLLGCFERLTVVSYDLCVCSWLENNTDATVIMIGGTIRHNFHCVSGLVTVNTINEMNFDKAFIAANGVTVKNGLSSPNMDIAMIKKALLNHTQKSYLLADSSKLGYDAFASFGKLSDIEVLITDDKADPSILSHIMSTGVNVLQAKTNVKAK